MASASATTSSDVLSARFATLRKEGRRALVCYVTAGHPDRTRSLRLLRGLARAGADVIEVGVPFSDPMADGPVIQASSQKAIEGGMTLDGTLALVQEAQAGVPVVLFSYLNPLIAAGPDVLTRAARAGCHGVLVTDLPLGADPAREAWLGQGPLAFVRLVAPTTPASRMADIARHGSGFVYLISRTGVTGEQAELPPELPATSASARRPTCRSASASASRARSRPRRWARSRMAWSSAVRSCARPIATSTKPSRSSPRCAAPSTA